MLAAVRRTRAPRAPRRGREREAPDEPRDDGELGRVELVEADAGEPLLVARADPDRDGVRRARRSPRDGSEPPPPDAGGASAAGGRELPVRRAGQRRRLRIPARVGAGSATPSTTAAKTASNAASWSRDETKLSRAAQ